MNLKNKYADSFNLGNKGEENWVLLMEARGNKVKKANKYEDTVLHWDFKITNKKGKTYTVDVKGRKSSSRGASELCDEVWVEYRNIHGNTGWLRGQADFIAFEFNHVFLVVSRKKLKKLCDKLINLNIPSPTPDGALYRRYSRHNRPREKTSKIKVQDIKDNIQYIEYEKIMGK